MDGIDVFIARSRGASAASADRWHRRTRPNAERGRRDTGGRPGTRAVRRGYPSIRRSFNGCGFADARQGLDMYPPLPRLRREYAPFMSADRCVPAGPPTEAKPPTNNAELRP
ncbi:MAG: hypothetical protein WCJ02_09010, partial [bacterium]